MKKQEDSEPNASGFLELELGHRLYWESHGNPKGLPAIYLHGGPGGSFNRRIPHMFDCEKYRVILYDQRGCGRSTPLANAFGADLKNNTTKHLIEDIELLREHLNVEKWVLLGLSWGTTLGLAYAQAHPGRVLAAVFGLVSTTSKREVEWITEGVGSLFPKEWERFSDAIPDHLRDRPLVDAYAELLFDSDPKIQAHAAVEWCRWEDAHVSLVPGYKPNSSFRDPEFRLLFSRLVTHYWRNHAFLEPDQLLRNVSILNGIPGVLIHGRYDVSSPLETAWNLSKKWTSARLEIIDEAGHGGPSIGRSVAMALEEFGDLQVEQRK